MFGPHDDHGAGRVHDALETDRAEAQAGKTADATVPEHQQGRVGSLVEQHPGGLTLDGLRGDLDFG